MWKIFPALLYSSKTKKEVATIGPLNLLKIYLTMLRYISLWTLRKGFIMVFSTYLPLRQTKAVVFILDRVYGVMSSQMVPVLSI